MPTGFFRSSLKERASTCSRVGGLGCQVRLWLCKKQGKVSPGASCCRGVVLSTEPYSCTPRGKAACTRRQKKGKKRKKGTRHEPFFLRGGACCKIDFRKSTNPLSRHCCFWKNIFFRSRAAMLAASSLTQHAQARSSHQRSLIFFCTTEAA